MADEAIKISDLKKLAKKRLDPEDYQQVAQKLDLAQRKENIRRDFEMLKPKHGARNSIKILADKYFLSENRVDEIVYRRERDMNAV